MTYLATRHSHLQALFRSMGLLTRASGLRHTSLTVQGGGRCLCLSNDQGKAYSPQPPPMALYPLYGLMLSMSTEGAALSFLREAPLNRSKAALSQTCCASILGTPVAPCSQFTRQLQLASQDLGTAFPGL